MADGTAYIHSVLAPTGANESDEAALIAAADLADQEMALIQLAQVPAVQAIAKPGPGQTQTIVVAPGAPLAFDFDPLSATAVPAGGNLVLTFATPGQPDAILILQGFEQAGPITLPGNQSASIGDILAALNLAQVAPAAGAPAAGGDAGPLGQGSGGATNTSPH